MSARVCFLRRAQAGATLRGVRLVGESSDESFPDGRDLSGEPADYQEAAAWVRQRLAARRSPAAVALLCLDAEGAACAWAQTQNADPALVSAALRFGTSEGAPAAGGALDFYAPTDAEGALQPLNPVDGPRRVAVLLAADVPARLFIDALDRQGVPVEGVATLWHAMASAWDPAAAPAQPSGQPVDAGPVTAILITDRDRLVWCWSHAGGLLVGGSLLLPPPRSDEDGSRAGSPPALGSAGRAQVARLVNEWLSWSVQLSVSPRRIVCVLGPADDAAALGEGLGAAWPGATVDVARHDDPLGATLTRAAARLEATPREASDAPDVTHRLPILSRRRVRAHRRMYRWWAGALLTLSVAVGVAAWRFGVAADHAREETSDWEGRWRDVIKETYPDALRPRLGVSPVAVLNEEIKRREQDMLPVEKGDQTMPILQELETISLVVSSAGCEVEEINLDSAVRPRLVVMVGSSQEAEAILQALRRIAGSHASGWTLSVQDRPSQGGERRVRAEYRGEWDREPARPAGGAA